ncbi:uncharacterized protein LOC143842424 [Paroedura picta]|uniref:uncharacterized protein LOC143842424 n=1 Tax=Paroedura picta TaxID=143630 RepID=UPI0040579204
MSERLACSRVFCRARAGAVQSGAAARQPSPAPARQPEAQASKAAADGFRSTQTARSAFWRRNRVRVQTPVHRLQRSNLNAVERGPASALVVQGAYEALQSKPPISPVYSGASPNGSRRKCHPRESAGTLERLLDRGRRFPVAAAIPFRFGLRPASFPCLTRNVFGARRPPASPSFVCAFPGLGLPAASRSSERSLLPGVETKPRSRVGPPTLSPRSHARPNPRPGLGTANPCHTSESPAEGDPESGKKKRTLGSNWSGGEDPASRARGGIDPVRVCRRPQANPARRCPAASPATVHLAASAAPHGPPPSGLARFGPSSAGRPKLQPVAKGGRLSASRSLGSLRTEKKTHSRGGEGAPRPGVSARVAPEGGGQGDLGALPAAEPPTSRPPSVQSLLPRLAKFGNRPPPPRPHLHKSLSSWQRKAPASDPAIFKLQSRCQTARRPARSHTDAHPFETGGLTSPPLPRSKFAFPPPILQPPRFSQWDGNRASRKRLCPPLAPGQPDPRTSGVDLKPAPTPGAPARRAECAPQTSWALQLNSPAGRERRKGRRLEAFIGPRKLGSLFFFLSFSFWDAYLGFFRSSAYKYTYRYPYSWW